MEIGDRVKEKSRCMYITAPGTRGSGKLHQNSACDQYSRTVPEPEVWIGPDDVTCKKCRLSLGLGKRK